MPLSDLSNPLTPLSVQYDAAIAAGWATSTDKADALDQFNWYQANKATLEQTYVGKWIAIANHQVFAADWRTDAEAAARAALPTRQYVLAAVPPTRLDLQLVDA